MSFVKDKRSSHRKLIGKGDIELQARQVFKNIKEVVHEAGASLQDIISMTVYLKDMSDLDRFCKVRQEFFKRDPPTSTAVQISALANPDALVEVNAIAVLSS